MMAAILVVIGCPNVGLAAECGQYADLIAKFMPGAVGDQGSLAKLLDVQGADWPGKLDPNILFRSLGEREFSGRTYKQYNIGLLRSKSSKLNYNLVQGKLKYVNQLRAFNFQNPGQAFDKEKGLTRVLQLIGTLGLPESETPLDKIQGQVLNGAAAQQKQIEPEKVYDIETSFFVPRLVNDIAVMQSIMVVGISNQGAVSQFRANWPPLRIDPSLLRLKAIDRQEVAQKVLDKMVADQGCVDLDGFGMFLAYVPHVQDLPDRSDKIPEVAKPIVYAPKLIVSFLPPKGEEAGSLVEFDLLQ